MTTINRVGVGWCQMMVAATTIHAGIGIGIGIISSIEIMKSTTVLVVIVSLF